jgi:predicted enzyme related to lactoylglutathione lyase
VELKGFIWAGLHVEDLEGAIAFYRDVVGMPVLRQGEDWAQMDAGNGSLFEIYGGGTSSQAPKEPAEQSLIIGMQVNDLDHAVGELAHHGVKLIGEIEQYRSTRWAQFADPEGNRLEIKQVPRRRARD